MNTIRVQSMPLALAAAAASLFIPSSLAIAQSSGAGQPPAQKQPPPAQQQPDLNSPAGIQSLLGGLNIGQLMMSFGGADGTMIDFTRSNERALLKRSDVRSELFIDSKQREQLLDLDKQGTQDLQKMVLQTVMQNLANNPDLKNLADQKNSGQPPDIATVKDTINASFQTIQDALQTFQKAQDGKGEALLNAKQIKRLHELDLQWRGLLALTDKTVADQMSVTPDQKAVVDAALKDYQAQQLAVLQPVMAQAIQLGQSFANGGPRGFDPAQIKKTAMDALEGEQMKKTRIADEDKIRAVLTADQKALWKKMIGEKFVFIRLDP